MSSRRLILRTYATQIRPGFERELDWFRGQPTLREAIRLAALAVNSRGKRYAHQRRMKREVLEGARDVLLRNEKSIAGCLNFDELYALLDRVLRPIKGLGELYVYDTALRIGASLGHLPQRVYLHAGTRLGARALGLDISAGTLEISQLPAWLRALPAYEIEDVLCIFKDHLGGAEKEAATLSANGRSVCD